MAFPTTGILDNFNRPDEGPPPSASWTGPMRPGDTNGLRVVSNTCQRVAPYGGAWWNVSSFGPDCEIYITCLGPSDFYLFWRIIDSPGTATADGYALNWFNDVITVRRLDNNTFTTLGAGISQTGPASGNKLGVSMIGSTITPYVDTGGGWTALSTRTDATYSNAGVIGANTDGTFDDFGGGTVVVADTSHAPHRLGGASAW